MKKYRQKNIDFSIKDFSFCHKFSSENCKRHKVFGSDNKFKSKDPCYPPGKSF